MFTKKLYIGRLNVVTSVITPNNLEDYPGVNINDIQVNSVFSKYVLVKKNKYSYKDIITGEKYIDVFPYPGLFLEKGDRFLDPEDLISYNEKFKNKKKFLTRQQVMDKFNK